MTERDTTILDVLPDSVPEVVRYFVGMMWQAFVSALAIAVVLMLIGALVAAMLFDTYTGILTGTNMLFAGLLRNIESGMYDLPDFVITISRHLPTIISIITTGIVFALWQRISALMRELYNAHNAGREPQISFSMAFGAFIGVVFQTFDTIFLDMPAAALFAGRGRAELFWPTTFGEWSAVLLVFLFTVLNDPITALIVSSAKSFMRKANGEHRSGHAAMKQRGVGRNNERRQQRGMQQSNNNSRQHKYEPRPSAIGGSNNYFQKDKLGSTRTNGGASGLEELRRKYGIE